MMDSPFPETADIETASDDYATRFQGEAGTFFLAVQRRMTLELLGDMPGASVLDVGGGHAQLARPLLDAGYQLTVTGSDDVCRKRLESSCETGSFAYITCDSLNLPYADNHFDIVMSFRLIPHAVRWQQLLSEMCRVAGKCVIFDYPDIRSANILYSLLFKAKKKMEGNTRTYSLFSRSEIARELARNHFCPPTFSPEFFMPMVIHRKLDSAKLSQSFESLFGAVGLTSLFGSPVIVRADKKHKETEVTGAM